MEKILDKVQKLLAMANHENANKHEGQSAMLKAQTLLKKHGLAMSDVEIEKDNKEVVDENVTEKAKTIWWIKNLSIIISENFRCKAYSVTYRGQSSLKFIGLKDDVRLAKEVLHYAITHIKSSASIEMKDVKKRLGYTPKGYRNDFYFGYLKGLKDMFDEQLKNDESLALVIVKDALVEKAIEEKGLKQTKVVNTITSSGSDRAIQNGYASGQSCNPNIKQLR